jgi:hypothetical protein
MLPGEHLGRGGGVPFAALIHNVASKKLVQAVGVKLNLLEAKLAEGGVAHDL